MNIKLAILYLAYLSILFFVDAVHDSNIFKSRLKIDDQRAESGWHLWDSLEKGFSAITVFILLHIIYFGFYIDRYFIISLTYGVLFFLSFRAFYFNIMLNIVRKLFYDEKIKIFHLSNNGLEGYFKKNRIGYIYWICIITISIWSYLKLSIL